MAPLDSTITTDAEPTLLSLLRELAEEQRQCRDSLGRLVALEEERREGERGMEALAQSLMPGAAPGIDVAALDWFNGRDGRYWVRDAAGDRPATADESVAIAAGIKGRRR